MNLFLFAKQFVDLLYPYHILDYIMVGIAFFMLGYQIILIRPDFRKTVQLPDCILIILAIMTTIRYVCAATEFMAYAKIMSAFLLYFLGRVYYERVQECGKVLVLSSYFVIYLNFGYRIWKQGITFWQMRNMQGDLYYCDTDMGFAMILATVFIVFLAKNTVLKLITILVIAPYMVLFSEAGIQAVLMIVTYGIFLIYVIEIALRKKKLGSVLLTGLLAVLLVCILFVHLPAMGMMPQEWIAKVFSNHFLSGENMYVRYERWKSALSLVCSHNTSGILFGTNFIVDVDSMYVKIFCTLGITGIILSVIFLLTLLTRIRYIEDRKTYYLVVGLILLFLGSGVIGNGLESTQMSWFPFLYMGMAVSAKKGMNKEKLNIVYFGQKHTYTREGGVEIVVAELATRMARRGHNVTCIDRRGHHISGAEYDETLPRELDGVKICSVPTIERKGLAAASSSFFATFKASFGKYDVVHIHAEGPAAFCWLPKLLGKRVVCTCHGLDWNRGRWVGNIGGKYIKYGEKMMVKYADAIIVLSRNIQQYFKENYHRETLFIPNGVTKPQIRFAKEINQKWGLEKDSYVLFLARLTEEKGVHYLIDAYKKIPTDKKLVIAGGVSDTDAYMRKLKKMAMEDERIIFTGFVQGNLLDELYSNAYVYVLPSDLEGMPLSLLEAMSYGNCCLVSDIPECTEVVEDKAVIFTKSDEINLGKKLETLLSDYKLVNDYKKAATDFICEKYNWDNVVVQTETTYYGGE